MVLSSAAFKQFLEANSNQHPYCDLRTTRSNYHCKWLMLKAAHPTSIRRRNGYFVLQSSCVSKSIQNEMIVSGTALPMPPMYDDIIDCVETWGTHLKCGWNLTVYEYLYKNANLPETKHSLYGECLYPMVKSKIAKHFMVATRREAIVAEWIKYYDTAFHTGEDFFMLAVGSMQLIRERADEDTQRAQEEMQQEMDRIRRIRHSAELAELNHGIVVSSPVPSAVVSSAVVSSSPDIVPPSPVSSQSM